MQTTLYTIRKSYDRQLLESNKPGHRQNHPLPVQEQQRHAAWKTDHGGVSAGWDGRHKATERRAWLCGMRSEEKSHPRHQTNCFLCFGWSQHANTIYEDLKGHAEAWFFFLKWLVRTPWSKRQSIMETDGLYRTRCCVAISKGGYG